MNGWKPTIGIEFDDKYIEAKNKLLEHDKKFDEVFNQLQQEENIRQKIFFEGQIYDAYSIIVDIIRKANSKLFNFSSKP